MVILAMAGVGGGLFGLGGFNCFRLRTSGLVVLFFICNSISCACADCTHEFLFFGFTDLRRFFSCLACRTLCRTTKAIIKNINMPMNTHRPVKFGSSGGMFFGGYADLFTLYIYSGYLVVNVEGPVLFVSADPFDFNVYDEFGLGV